MITLTPVQFQSIVNAAFIEMSKNQSLYSTSLPKLKELYKWIMSIDWDTTTEEIIMIDELPF